MSKSWRGLGPFAAARAKNPQPRTLDTGTTESAPTHAHFLAFAAAISLAVQGGTTPFMRA
jgi:hypothetical protein